MIFKIEGKELRAANEFIAKQMKIDSSLPTAGERWTYIFTPTGIGTVIKIKDENLKCIEDITDWEMW